MAAASLRCAEGHGFDVARQGYVNLLPGGARPGTADTADMVAARAAFLSAGHYAPLARAIADLAACATATAPGAACATATAPGAVGATATAPGPPQATVAAPGAARVLDAGAGTGYYLAAVLDRLEHGTPRRDAPLQPASQDAPVQPAGPAGLAMDISVRALRRAARAHPAIGAVAWDVWRPLPVRDGAVSLVINVFAPRNGAEFRRVLRPGGALIVVTPAPGHLAELAGAGLLAVDDRKEERLAAALGDHFRQVSQEELAITLRLGHEDAAGLVAMGPAAWHSGAAAIRDRLARWPAPVTVTAAFRIAVYQPRPPVCVRFPL